MKLKENVMWMPPHTTAWIFTLNL
nr:hypothetical protein [Metallosphaera tengchongensis]